MDNNTVLMKCSNKDCFFNKQSFPMPFGSEKKCLICDSNLVIDIDKHWLIKLSEQNTFWMESEYEKWPCVIAFEYNRLKELCKKRDSYGVLLCLKDNIESLLKFETLISYAWAAERMDSLFEEEVISLITTPNLSLGSWKELATLIVKNLKQRKTALPQNIPLETIVSLYDKYSFINWRNEKVGHGTMGFEEDERFKDDIIDKINHFNKVLYKIKNNLEVQELFMYVDNKKVKLTGSQKARNLSENGDIFICIDNENDAIKLAPFISIDQNETTGSGVYFFDNQKKTTLSVFQAYAEGLNIRRRNPYFERLREYLDNKSISLNEMADNPNKTPDEYRILDMAYVVESYVEQEHITLWLKRCVGKYKKGIFMLQMERGMGKSVFSEKLNRLFSSPTIISDELDVRTYHLSRVQSGGQDDIITYIEWMWDHNYIGDRYMGIKHVSDLQKEGICISTAFVEYLRSVLQSRKLREHTNKVMMVFDGLDEVVEESIKELLIFDNGKLPEGVYILFTSRNLDAEIIDSGICEFIKNIKAADYFICSKESDYNIEFLKRYISTTRLSNIDEGKKIDLIKKSSYRVLELSLLCHLLENGIDIEELEDVHDYIFKYIELLKQRYSNKDFLIIKEVLIIISLLGRKGLLTLKAIGQLSSENSVSIKLVGIISDISPLLDVERSEIGNCYRISNSAVENELIKIIPESRYYINSLIQIGIASMREKVIPEDFGGEELLCQNIVDIAEMLPEGVEIFGNDIFDLLSGLCDRCSESSHIKKLNSLYRYKIQLYRLYKQKYGELANETINCKADISDVLNKLGQNNEAIKNTREVLELRKRVLGENNLDTIQTMYMLAKSIGTSSVREHNIETLSLYKAVYKKRKELLGEENIETMNALSDIALSYEIQGDYREALEHYNKLYELKKRIYGDKHKDTLSTLGDISVAYSMMGEHEKAVDIYKRIYLIQKDVFGKVADRTLKTIFEIAKNLYELDKKDEAYELCKEISEVIMGKSKSDPSGLHLLSLVAFFLERKLNNHIACENLLDFLRKKCSYIIKDDNLLRGDQFEEVSRSIHSFVTRLNYLNKIDEAIKLQKQYLDRCLEIFGYKNRRTEMSRQNLAVMLSSAGRYEEALKELRTNYENQKRIYGESENTLNTLMMIGDVLCRMKKYDESLKMIEKVLEVSKDINLSKPSFNQYLSLQSIMGIDYYETGRLEDSLNILKYVFDEFLKPGRSLIPKIIEDWDKLSLVIDKLGISKNKLEDVKKYNYSLYLGTGVF